MANFTPQELEEILEQFFDVVGKRQYIGARYVPIFGRKGEDTIQWDGGVAPYEPLTIVLYEGNSYTSRTYVPIGIDIMDQHYWANTGNYNAQVEAYRAEVLAFDERITNNANDIDALDGILPKSGFTSTNTVKKYIDDAATAIEDIIPATSFNSTDTVKKYIDDADTAIEDIIPATSFNSTDTVKKYIDDAATAIEDIIPATSFNSTDTVKKYIDDNINNLSYRKAIYIGNSYAIGTGSTSGTDGLFALTKDVFDEAELVWISSVGFSTYNYNGVTTTDSFLTMIQTKAASMTGAERSATTDIVVISAVGDDRVITANGDQSVVSGITGFCNYVVATFPNAQIHIVSASSNKKYGLGDVTPNTMWWLNRRFIRSKNSNRYHYIGLLGSMIAHDASFFASDGYHPNDRGYALMAPILAEALKNGGMMQYADTLKTDFVVNSVNQKVIPVWIMQRGIDGIRIKLLSLDDNELLYAVNETIPMTFTCDISESLGATVYNNSYTTDPNNPSSKYKNTYRGLARVATLNGTAPVQYIPFSCAVSSTGVLTIKLSHQPATLTTQTYLWFLEEIWI